MSLRSDHKALVFLGAVGVLGAGVRVVRAAGKESIPAVQPALEHQARVADSAAQAQRGAKGKKKGRGGRDATSKTERDQARPAPPGSADRPGYVRGRLDLDVATAAQIDSLPGVSAGMARRIVMDRQMRGPFVTRDGLRRVEGAGPVFVAKIDSLVMFSGTFLQPGVGDTVMRRVVRPRAKRRP